MDALYLAQFSENKSERRNPRKCGKETEISKVSQKKSHGMPQLHDFLKLATWAKFAPVYVHDQLGGKNIFFQFSKKQKAMIFNGL